MLKFGRRHGAVYQNAEGLRSCDDGVDNAYVIPSDGDSLEDDEDFADFDDFDDDELPGEGEVNQNDSGFQSSSADAYEQPNSQLFRYYRSEMSADVQNGQANSKDSSAVVEVRKTSTGRPTMPPPPLPSQRLALLHAEAETIPTTTPPPLPPLLCSFDHFSSANNVKSKALMLEQLLKANGKALTPPPERRVRGLLELLSQSRRHASLPDTGVAVVQHLTQAKSSVTAHPSATHPRCLPGGTKRLKTPSPPIELRINYPPPPPPISSKPPNLANSHLRPLPIEPPNRKFSTQSAGRRSFEKTNLTCSETDFRRPSRRADSETPVAVGRTPSTHSISGPISILASTNTALSKPIAQIYPNSRTSSSAGQSTHDVEQKVELDQKPWFHGIIDRKEAERRLRVMPLNGTFLVRQHRVECAERPFVMSVYYGGKCYHSFIRNKSNGQFAAGQYTKPMEEEFESVESLIAYYRDMDLCLLNRENPNKVSCATLLTLAAPKNSI